MAVSIASVFRRSVGGVFPAILLAGGLLGPALAGPGSSPQSGDPNRRRGTRTDGFLRQLDANHDGIIDAGEVRPEQKSYLDRISERYGVSIQFPLSIAKYREVMDAHYARQGNNSGSSSGGRPSGPGYGPPGGGPPGAVSGFGGSPSGGSVGGSGGGMTSPAPAASPSTSNAMWNSSSPAATTALSQIDERIRGYATGLMKRYDKNGNGRLERDEWGQIRGDWKSTDTNGDDIISLDEIINRFASYRARYVARASTSSGSSGSSSTGPASASMPVGSSAGTRPVTADGRKPYRFLTPTERLPAGLPDWFSRKDANGDAQVTLAEYSDSLTEETAADFARYDLNNDGVITAAECLAAQRQGR